MRFRYFPKQNVVLFVGDVGIISCAYLLSSVVRFGAFPHHNILQLLTGVSFLIAYLVIFYLVDFYNNDEVSLQRMQTLFKHLMGVFAVGAALSVYFYLFSVLRSSRGVFLASVVLAGVGTYVWRVAFFSLFKKKLIGQKRLLIIGGGRAGEALYEIVKDNPDYRVLGLLTDDSSHLWKAGGVPPVSGSPATLRRMSRALEVNVLVLAANPVRDPELLKAVLDCKLDGVMVYDMPSFYENLTGKVPVEHVTDFWLVFTPLLGTRKNIYNRKFKRGCDMVLAFLGMVLTLPLSLAVALAVKIDSPGPVLYRQRRVGLNDRPFTLLKFRSMQNGKDRDREHAGEKHDPRITRVGKVLRLFRLDELPQMWNVLKGEMSFIGPRALMEEEVAQFESRIPYFSLRHSVRPGITGWAQISYKHGATVEDGLEKLKYDLFYIKNLSPFLDFVILMKTVRVVLSGTGAR